MVLLHLLTFYLIRHFPWLFIHYPIWNLLQSFILAGFFSPITLVKQKETLSIPPTLHPLPLQILFSFSSLLPLSYQSLYNLSSVAYNKHGIPVLVFVCFVNHISKSAQSLYTQSKPHTTSQSFWKLPFFFITTIPIILHNLQLLITGEYIFRKQISAEKTPKKTINNATKRWNPFQKHPSLFTSTEPLFNFVQLYTPEQQQKEIS